MLARTGSACLDGSLALSFLLVAAVALAAAQPVATSTDGVAISGDVIVQSHGQPIAEKPISLHKALDHSRLHWTTGGEADWFGETALAHDGRDAGCSGGIADNQQSWMQTTVKGPGTVRFWWKVSSEPYFDWLEFYIDDALQERISGETDWQQWSCNLAEGHHVLKWRYIKDSSVSTSSDCGWVDQVAFGSEAQAGVLYVDASSRPGGDGSSWKRAYNELQLALAAARESGVSTQIWVAAGTYRPDYDPATGTHTDDREDCFELVSGAALYGGFAGREQDLSDRDWKTHETILSGDIGISGYRTDDSWCVVRAQSVGEGVVLDGFTIRDGTNTWDSPWTRYFGGAGLFVGGQSSPTLENLKFVSNYSESYGGALTLNSCTWPAAQPRVVRCEFYSNSAYAGGGVFCIGSIRPVFVDSLFRYNLAIHRGAALDCNGSVQLSDCLLADNSSMGFGGALYSYNLDQKVLTNCTIVNNQAADGGGIYHVDSSLLLTSCILWNNTDATGAGESAQLHMLGGDVGINYSCIGGWTGSLGGIGNIAVDPLLTATHHLGRASPCIDAGDPAYRPAEGEMDIDGEARISGDCVDIGCDEYLPAPVAGDTNRDSVVDVVDLLTLAETWGKNNGDDDFDPMCDLNKDGCVDVVDLLVLVENFGT